MNILITGGSGRIGAYLTYALADDFAVLTPSSSELDITDETSVISYFDRNDVSAVIHAAAYTDLKQAERERGDESAACYQVNVVGTRNIVHSASLHNAHMVYASTASVFTSKYTHLHLHDEDDDPSKTLEHVSWYAATKFMGEQEVGGSGAVLRLSHPTGPDHDRCATDYVHRMIRLYDDGRLYPLLVDNAFAMTYFPDLVRGLQRIIQEQMTGVFHISSPDVTTHFDFVSEVLRRSGRDASSLQKMTTEELLSSVSTDQRRQFSRGYAVSSDKSSARLGMSFATISQIIEAITPIP